jgi:hypothetical protein
LPPADKVRAKVRIEIEKMDPHVCLPGWSNVDEWVDSIERENAGTAGRMARIRPYYKTLPLETANSIALWRLGEWTRWDMPGPLHRLRQLRLGKLPPAKKTRDRKRKSIPGLWEPLLMFWHPPVIPALWTFRDTWPGRIGVAEKPPWIRSSTAWTRWPNLIKLKYRGRASWRKPLKPDDWRVALAQERRARVAPEVWWSPRDPIWVTTAKRVASQRR